MNVMMRKCVFSGKNLAFLVETIIDFISVSGIEYSQVSRKT